MKVSTSDPFKIIYSLFEHEYLGYLIESFVVQLDQTGKLTLTHQNISFQNAKEFSSALDEIDYKLIKLMDSMQQEVVIHKFYNKHISVTDFFQKIYSNPKFEETKANIVEYLEGKRSQVLEILQKSGKDLYEMGNDGEPAQHHINIQKEKASVLFHFRRNDDNTHYFPTIKHGDNKVEFQYKGAFLICNTPAWMICSGKLYSFKKNVDGKKIKPFLNKKFIAIPKAIEEKYYNNFVANLIADYDVYAKGFDIVTEREKPVPYIYFLDIVDEGDENKKAGFELYFKYGSHLFKYTAVQKSISVEVNKDGDNYTFVRVKRDSSYEQFILNILKINGVDLIDEHQYDIGQAMDLLNGLKEVIENNGIQISQSNTKKEIKYFLGKPSIEIKINENIDWFDIEAVIMFGSYQISFKELRKAILSKKGEFKLPNGEIAVIPDEWRVEYSELFAFIDESDDDDSDVLKLKKYHVALIKELEGENLAKITMSRKLQKLQNFEEIEDAVESSHFIGSLRSYQKAGLNWMTFLQKYNFGGCLADDMGLGKTVQTLAMLQNAKDAGSLNATLLIMPTSLIYNWEAEAKKFTPDLRVFVYTGTNRVKDPEQFKDYDLVLTSYGIVRLDIDILQEYYFNYVILDESQAIKNPNSIIAKSVNKLKSRFRLILTGTPLENSTMDIWSQMNFINKGLLGDQKFFKSEFLVPIEKKRDDKKMKKLYSIIKPFILRRNKTQVATELPEKVEQIKYSIMTQEQKKCYDEVKSYYRNKILDEIDLNGMGKSQFMLLQGLTKLRQIANHPRMADQDYKGDSGKLEEVTNMIERAISEDHKMLIFSQFVKHLTIVREYLDQEGIKYTYLDGTTKNRKEQVDKFQNDETVKVFLISLKAGGVGLNLTKADYVFILDPWWNPAIEAQAVDRAHRIGQENTVFTYKFIGKDTVEEKILALQHQKKSLAGNLITTEESFVKELSKEDIESLLS
ncbi:DEAD/DEAH box helicase [Aureibacter tunicatorum]|uniref:SNF2 family DNA or RNA helicase n=1 Tax=Aureibacter tunicatorum TaxID=866807 RepID=A0AAE3XIT5_9BACT|nr:DEAD/DEAH box helicase [Aureibacter tunicatorum]MDR6237498.1 SNF2 family DNA or RNA helicase [Aureibacter tunicatorum]BDD02532.1 hypothetical protein AUTU_00150 [Aureibacter tunicatorum]